MVLELSVNEDKTMYDERARQREKSRLYRVQNRTVLIPNALAEESLGLRPTNSFNAICREALRLWIEREKFVAANMPKRKGQSESGS